MGQVIAHLLREMPSCKFESELWCLEEADELGRQLKSEGIKVIEFSRQRRRDFKLILKIARQLKANNINILHCHDELSWFYGTLASFLSPGTAVVVTMHGRRPDISSRHLFEQKFLSRITSRIISVSEFLRRQLLEELKLDSKKVTTILNGIPVPPMDAGESKRIWAKKKLNLPLNGLSVGSVGRLAKVKNYPLLIEASAELSLTIPGLKVVLIGEGPSRDELSRLVTSRKMESSVLFTGSINNVSDFLPALDIYVCTSDYEGISLSILEAMAAGRPVVATDVGGNPEIIHHNKTGLLFPKGEPEALRVAINELYQDRERRHYMGNNARAEIENSFNVSRMITEYGHIYGSSN
jgi:glycosyltransferase involved in cell wall biosynthesis